MTNIDTVVIDLSVNEGQWSMYSTTVTRKIIDGNTTSKVEVRDWNDGPRLIVSTSGPQGSTEHRLPLTWRQRRRIKRAVYSWMARLSLSTLDKLGKVA